MPSHLYNLHHYYSKLLYMRIILTCFVFLLLSSCSLGQKQHKFTTISDGIDCSNISSAFYINGVLCEENKNIEISKKERTVKFITVEIDDFGEFYSEKQVQTAIDAVSQANENSPTLLLTFIHGWRHSASEASTNLRDFRKLFFDLAKNPCNLEGSIIKNNNADNSINNCKYKNVVGIYIGWRGDPLNLPKSMSFLKPLQLLTFWNRKNATNEVANTNATNFLLKLSENLKRHDSKRLKVSCSYLSYLKFVENKPIDEDCSKSIVIGHSFGGRILENTVAQAMLGSRFLASRIDINSQLKQLENTVLTLDEQGNRIREEIKELGNIEQSIINNSAALDDKEMIKINLKSKRENVLKERITEFGLLENESKLLSSMLLFNQQSFREQHRIRSKLIIDTFVSMACNLTTIIQKKKENTVPAKHKNLNLGLKFHKGYCVNRDFANSDWESSILDSIDNIAFLNDEQKQITDILCGMLSSALILADEKYRSINYPLKFNAINCGIVDNSSVESMLSDYHDNLDAEYKNIETYDLKQIESINNSHIFHVADLSSKLSELDKILETIKSRNDIGHKNKDENNNNNTKNDFLSSPFEFINKLNNIISVNGTSTNPLEYYDLNQVSLGDQTNLNQIPRLTSSDFSLITLASKRIDDEISLKNPKINDLNTKINKSTNEIDILDVELAGLKEKRELLKDREIFIGDSIEDAKVQSRYNRIEFILAVSNFEKLLENSTKPPFDLALMVNPATGAVASRMLSNAICDDNLNGLIKSYDIPAIPWLISLSSESDGATRFVFDIATGLEDFRLFKSQKDNTKGNRVGVFAKCGGHILSDYTQRKLSAKPAPFVNGMKTHTVADVKEFKNTSAICDFEDDFNYSEGMIGGIQSGSDIIRYSLKNDNTCSNYLGKFGVVNKNTNKINKNGVIKVGIKEDVPSDYWIMTVPKQVIPDHSTIFTYSMGKLVTYLLNKQINFGSLCKIGTSLREFCGLLVRKTHEIELLGNICFSDDNPYTGREKEYCSLWKEIDRIQRPLTNLASR